MKVQQLLEDDPLDDLQHELWKKLARTQDWDACFRVAGIEYKPLPSTQVVAALRFIYDRGTSKLNKPIWKVGDRILFISTSSTPGSGTILHVDPNLRSLVIVALDDTKAKKRSIQYLSRHHLYLYSKVIKEMNKASK